MHIIICYIGRPYLIIDLIIWFQQWYQGQKTSIYRNWIYSELSVVTNSYKLQLLWRGCAHCLTDRSDLNHCSFINLGSRLVLLYCHYLTLKKPCLLTPSHSWGGGGGGGGGVDSTPLGSRPTDRRRIMYIRHPNVDHVETNTFTKFLYWKSKLFSNYANLC